MVYWTLPSLMLASVSACIFALHSYWTWIFALLSWGSALPMTPESFCCKHISRHPQYKGKGGIRMWQARFIGAGNSQVTSLDILQFWWSIKWSEARAAVPHASLTVLRPLLPSAFLFTSPSLSLGFSQPTLQFLLIYFSPCFIVLSCLHPSFRSMTLVGTQTCWGCDPPGSLSHGLGLLLWRPSGGFAQISYLHRRMHTFSHSILQNALLTFCLLGISGVIIFCSRLFTVLTLYTVEMVIMHIDGTAKRLCIMSSAVHITDYILI